MPDPPDLTELIYRSLNPNTADAILVVDDDKSAREVAERIAAALAPHVVLRSAYDELLAQARAYFRLDV